MTTIAQFNALAAEQIGVPYVFGGTSLKGSPRPGLDCSGFPFAVARAFGVSIPRTSEAQFAGLPPVSASDLRQGDLAFYDVEADPQPQPAHEAIWWSATEVLQAPRTGLNVGFSPPLPYPIMGYRRLPFPSVPPPAPPSENEDEMTYWQSGGFDHVAGVIPGLGAFHWWQPPGGWPPGQSPTGDWKVEQLPT